MDTTATVAAPAQSEVPVSISAADDAINRGDFSALQSARRAERTGQPLPPVDATADPASPVSEPAPAAPENRKTRAEKEQERINASIREAIAAATAPLKAELARLQAPTTPKAEPTPATAAAPKPDRFQSLDEWSKANPSASLEDYLEARDAYREERRATTERQRRSESTAVQALVEQTNRFAERMAQAKAADPEILSKIPPAIQSARPLSGLSPAEMQTATFGNFVAEAAFRSDNPIALLTHLHAHKDEAAAMAQRAPSEWLPALLRLDGRLAGAAPMTSPAAPASSAAAIPSTVANVPPPPPTVSNKAGATADPATAAMQRGDFAGYRAARRAERVASARGGM